MRGFISWNWRFHLRTNTELCLAYIREEVDSSLLIWTYTLEMDPKGEFDNEMGIDSWRRSSERTEADSIVSLFFHQVAWVLWFSVCFGGGVVMFVS